MSESLAVWRAASGPRDRARGAPGTITFAVLGVAGPCLALALLPGGMQVASHTAVYGIVFAILAVWGAVRSRAGEGLQVPLATVVLLGWPLLQLIPLPLRWLAHVAPERAAEWAGFARQGIVSRATVSLYPYATAGVFLSVAAAVALFMLARDLGRREPRVILWVAAALLVGLAAEAALGLGQYLRALSGVGREWGTATMQARGTFGNRNLLAAWLEGGCGLALGLAAGWWRPGLRALASGAATAGLAGVLGILATFSRMGLVALASLVLLFAAAEWRRREPGWWPALAAVLAVASAAAVVGWPELARRYQAETLAVERQGRLAMWRDSMTAVRRYWLTGAGAGAFPWAFRRSQPYLVEYTVDHPHNDVIETAVEWGVPVTVLLAVGGLAALAGLVARLRRAPEGWRETGLGCAAGAAAMLVHGLADFPLRIPGLLALWSILLGLAAACATSGTGRVARPRGRTSAALAAVAAIVLAGLAGWAVGFTAEGLESWNAEAFYRQVRELVDAGKPEAAERACRRGLARNPYAAPLWDEAALLAEARGASGAALARSETALRLEPHARRALWTAANVRLRQGEGESAALLLAEVLAKAPLWRPAAAEVWWSAGFPGRLLLGPLTALAPEVLDDYVRLAIARGRWEAVAEAAAYGIGRGLVSQPALRAATNGLFAAGRDREIGELWRRAGGEDGFANGNLAREPRGWGLDWVLWDVEGVAARRVRDGDGFRLDVEFTRPQNLSYAGVTHDFLVAPGRDHRLRLEMASDGIESATGVQVEVTSARRSLATSEPLRRTNLWRTVELRFRPGLNERVCRLRVLRPLSARFDNRIRGRFSLRRVRLVPPA